MVADNMSVQPRKTDSEGRIVERPSMKQDSHPEHNMPKPEHEGSVFPHPVQGDSDYMSRSYDDQGQ